MIYYYELRKGYLDKFTLPYLAKARARGCRTVTDLHEAFTEERAKVLPARNKMSRSEFYHLLCELRELGLDPGPDDRSTARKYGRPTRGAGAGKQAKL
jgi:hypothetical protein